eukprot:TRINITY_DN15163_c0_g1_i1.p1 TRINITY_DN15163_c0_g1~~TRINITY_DN15163_c0_g1_i1.p1  ORF type:complete len:139 (+),score=19.54 TRINITY_DN15163_c0_g1_i1:42-419(+)
MTDPFDSVIMADQTAFASAYKEGEKAALDMSHSEGEKSGRLQGLKYGLEIGFFQGLSCHEILDSKTRQALDDTVKLLVTHPPDSVDFLRAEALFTRLCKKITSITGVDSSLLHPLKAKKHESLDW